MTWTRAHQADILHLFIEVLSPRRARSPSALRVPPINPLKQVAKLSRRNRDDAVGRRRPNKTTSFEPFGIERQPEPVMPKDFDEIAATTSENVEIAGVGITAKRLLHLQGQAWHAAAHVG